MFVLLDSSLVNVDHIVSIRARWRYEGAEFERRREAIGVVKTIDGRMHSVRAVDMPGFLAVLDSGHWGDEAASRAEDAWEVLMGAIGKSDEV